MSLKTAGYDQRTIWDRDALICQTVRFAGAIGDDVPIFVTSSRISDASTVGSETSMKPITERLSQTLLHHASIGRIERQFGYLAYRMRSY